MSTPNRPKRSDLNIKRTAIEYWLTSGKSAEVVAAKLGVSDRRLKIQEQQLEVPPPPNRARTLGQLQKDNRQLRRKLSRALRRCDILKRTLGILSGSNGIALKR